MEVRCPLFTNAFSSHLQKGRQHVRRWHRRAGRPGVYSWLGHDWSLWPWGEASFSGLDVLIWKMRGRADCFKGQSPQMSRSALSHETLLFLSPSVLYGDAHVSNPQHGPCGRKRQRALADCTWGQWFGRFTECTTVTVFWCLASKLRRLDAGESQPQGHVTTLLPASAEDGVGVTVGSTKLQTNQALSLTKVPRESARWGSRTEGKPFLSTSRTCTQKHGTGIDIPA